VRHDDPRRQERFATPSAGEWEIFRQWAEREGWRVPARELTLYRHELVDSAFVLRGAAGEPLGFVTICRHQRSGWIGNLIVAPERRGSGHGRQLFRHAVECLATRGVNALWLTASSSGQPLYESSGFREAGRIERWRLVGDSMSKGGSGSGRGGELYQLAQADAAAWGHSRSALLSLLAKGGKIFTSGSTVAMLQAGDKLQVLGPWLSADLCPRANRTVLNQVLDAWDGVGEIAVDAIGGNPVRLLLHAAGFRQSGETVLMTRGTGKVRLGEIVALASLGSMG